MNRAISVHLIKFGMHFYSGGTISRTCQLLHHGEKWYVYETMSEGYVHLNWLILLKSIDEMHPYR